MTIASSAKSSERAFSEYLPSKTARCSSSAPPVDGSRRQGRGLDSASAVGHSNRDINDNGHARALVVPARKGKNGAGTHKTRNRDSHLFQAPTTAQKADPHSQKVSKRSSSTDRITRTKEKKNPQKAEPVKRRSGSLPKRTKSNQKKGRRESDDLQAKKKAPIRRTRSYESISTTPKDRKPSRIVVNLSKEHGNRSFSNLLVDERGLPLTSVGCAPVASLRPSTTTNKMDTESFDAMYARKLQQEECSRARHDRPRLDRRTSSGRSLGSSRSLGDCKMPAVEGDRKIPAKQRRSKSSKRASRKDNMGHNLIVPLNPEESIQYHRKNFATEAKRFVTGLVALLQDVSRMATCRSVRSTSKEPIFSGVLADNELKDLVISMFQTQKNFRDHGKPYRLDIGYHFCRGSNMKRIQQQPGLWSKIQAKGVSRSQDGEGIYTFNNPPSSAPGNLAAASNGEQLHDVWMVVARIRGKSCNATPSRQQWTSEIDSLVRPENNVVVLKASTQFFPLAQFRSMLLTPGSFARGGGHISAITNHIQLVQEKLQLLLDKIFNVSTGQQKAVPFPDRFATINRHQEDQPRRPLSFNEQLDAVSNPSAWELASEVQAVVAEHAGAARAVVTDLGISLLAVQSAVSAEEMAVLADNLFKTKQRFAGAKKPAYIDIGYHYCRGQNLKKMQQEGFWSNIQSRGFNKSEDGDGIYTFNDPLGTRTRGNRSGFFDMRQSIGIDDDVWLLVARLTGRSTTPSSSPSADTGRKWDKSVDALILGGRQSDDVTVLRTSAQFFPVVQFSASSMDTAVGSAQYSALGELQLVHQRLQHIFDKFFNHGATMTALGVPASPQKRINEDVLDYCAPNDLDVTKSIYSSSQQIYKVLSSNKKAANDDCSICLDSLRHTDHQQVARLRVCGHEFHRACLHEALQHFDLCPICNQDVTPPSPQACLQGLSPSGIMVATTEQNTFCDGCWAPAGSLLLSFFLPEGQQKLYHENPGAKHRSSNWKAFLPNNEHGLRLLRRLQYAFLHGLLFSVQPAQQVRESEGIIVRASIPLKTRPRSTGAVAGADTEAFPDPAYFSRCNHELDRCGVPDSATCELFIGQELEAANLADRVGVENPSQCAMSLHEIEECERVLKRLQKHQHGWMFCKALPALDGRVENPMDFTMIEAKLARHEYKRVEEYVRDVNLTFDNAMAYYSKENPVHYMAKQLRKRFKKDLRQLQIRS